MRQPVDEGKVKRWHQLFVIVWATGNAVLLLVTYWFDLWSQLLVGIFYLTLPTAWLLQHVYSGFRWKRMRLGEWVGGPIIRGKPAVIAAAAFSIAAFVLVYLALRIMLFTSPYFKPFG